VDGFKHTMEAMPEGSTRRTYGTAYYDGTTWWANINGSLVGCRWLDPIQPLQGGNIVVDITNEGRGQHSALVIGGYTDQPRPSTGSVVSIIPAGIATEIVFTGSDGETYTTDRFIGSYSPGDPVYVTWDAAKPTVIGKIATIATPPPAAAPPPAAPPAGNGNTKLSAIASDTFGVGGWGRWALSQRGGEHLYSGTWSGYTLTASWFYGAPRPELAGKTATAVRFRLPARLRAGNYNSPATVNIYAHTSPSRPGGDVSRVAGPHTVVVQPNAAAQIIDLPTSFGPIIAAGGGISIAGGDYVWFQSRLEDPESGKLDMDWTA
jgi:hypothetical protein